MLSAEKAAELGLKPVAKIISYADAAQEPEWFTTLRPNLRQWPSEYNLDQVDYFELMKPFVVGLANTDILGLDAAKVNVNGGAVSLGHPLGTSGARIVTTLIYVLEQNDGTIAAAICNGGGGASAMVERL